MDERYHRYLCSPEWGRMRRAVFDRARGRCERCRNASANHVHHLTYIRLYAEDLDDLQAVCKPCHDFIHGHSDHDPCGWTPTERRQAEATIDRRERAERDAWRRRFVAASAMFDSWPDERRRAALDASAAESPALADHDWLLRLHAIRKLTECGSEVSL